jgi:predicted MFS family arabinose efflux permease
MTIGAFWSISAGLAERLVNPGSTSLANSIILSAVPLGSVPGLPLGTFIGDAFGWRSAFFAAGLLTVLVLVAIPLTVPKLPATAARTTARSLTKMAARPGIRTGVAVTFLAHFGTYTYIRPFLQNQVHAGPMFITALLLLYGIAGMIGNFVAGRYARRRPSRVLAIAGALVLTAIASAPPGDTGPSGATPAEPAGKPRHPRRPETLRGRRTGR